MSAEGTGNRFATFMPKGKGIAVPDYFPQNQRWYFRVPDKSDQRY